MTILQALNSYYGRMAARNEAVAEGYSREKISYAILLRPDGSVADVQDIRIAQEKGKFVSRIMAVPAAKKRASGINPNILWDKSSYVLGVAAEDPKRTGKEHEAFQQAHAEMLQGSQEVGLLALQRFLQQWTPEQFESSPYFKEEMKDTNIVFRMDGEKSYIHEHPAAVALVKDQADSGDGEDVMCLVTGEMGKAARLHPSVKGVLGAQTSGASLVSFNQKAFESYGKEQGANAPVSVSVAGRYGIALNALLEQGSGNQIQIGDATTVFWADASGTGGESSAQAAEQWTINALEPRQDQSEAKKVSEQLGLVAKGRPVATLSTEHIHPATRFCILGLAASAARLSVRFWYDGSFGEFERRMRDYWQDMLIEPMPRRWPPAARGIIWLTVREQARELPSERDKKAVERTTADLMQAILFGTAYPQTLLHGILARIRAGEPITGLHAAVCKAFIVRNWQHGEEDMKPGLNPDSAEPAYHLGRLFAVMEQIQRAAHYPSKLNSTIRDRFYTAASTAPASVYGTLFSGMKNNLSKLRKDRPSYAFYFDKTVGGIVSKMADDWPKSLPLKEQARFAVGYYHQRFGEVDANQEIQDELAEGGDGDE